MRTSETVVLDMRPGPDGEQSLAMAAGLLEELQSWEDAQQVADQLRLIKVVELGSGIFALVIGSDE